MERKIKYEADWLKAYSKPSEQKTIDLITNWLYEDFDKSWLSNRYHEEGNAADEEGNGDDFPASFGWFVQAWQIELLEYDVALEDIKPLEILTEVGHLEIEVKPDTDLSPLGSMTNLRRLKVFGSHNGDYSFLKSLVHLEELYLARGIGGRNLDAVGSLKNLKRLTLFTCNDLTDIAGASNLEFLDVQRCFIRDLDPIRNMKSLEYLFIQDNLIADIAVLRELPKLHRLELSNNCITDFSALETLNMQEWVRKELRSSRQLNGTHELLQPVRNDPRNLMLWLDYTRWLIQQGDPLGEKLKEKIEGRWNQLPIFWAVGNDVEKKKENNEWYYRTTRPVMNV